MISGAGREEERPAMARPRPLSLSRSLAHAQHPQSRARARAYARTQTQGDACAERELVRSAGVPRAAGRRRGAGRGPGGRSRAAPPPRCRRAPCDARTEGVRPRQERRRQSGFGKDGGWGGLESAACMIGSDGLLLSLSLSLSLFLSPPAPQVRVRPCRAADDGASRSRAAGPRPPTSAADNDSRRSLSGRRREMTLTGSVPRRD